jgi:sugar phosphate isomerase/epimerase
MNPELGLQLYSVRNAMERDYPATLEKAAAIGYRNLELLSKETEDGLVFGPGMQAPEHRKLLDRLGLKAVGCHFMPEESVSWEKVAASCLETGVNTLVIPFALFKDRQDVLSFCEQTNRAATICNKLGVQLYYHNHIQEFESFDGQTAMDIMLENLDEDLVKYEFDSYWAIRAGQDPIAWIRKFGKRCDLLHQKDLPSSVNPVNLFDLRADDPKMSPLDMLRTVQDDQYTEVGEGVLNIPEIIAAGRTYGNVRYIFVEQDGTTREELESVAISYKNIKRLLSQMGI